jgi:signal transduction histidine kinase
VNVLQRLWPRTLVGQILLAAALALGLAQTVNFVLLLRSMETQAIGQASAFAGGRLIFVASDDRRTQRMQRRAERPSQRRGGEGVRRRNSTLFSSAPPAVAGESQPDAALRIMDAARQNDVQFQAVRVTLADRADVPPPMRRRDGRQAGLRDRLSPGAAPATRSLVVSAQLGSGQWVSTASALPQRGAPVIGWLIGQTLILYLAILLPLAFIAHRVTRPLRTLTGRANAFSAESIHAPLAEKGPEDIRNLIAAINAMEGRVTALIGEKDVMLGAIGHDLKTPLAALRVRIESVDDDEERERMAASIDEMVGILDDILVLARLGRSGEALRRTDLTALTETVVAEFVDRGGAATLADASGLVIADIRPVLIRRALRNLIGNALKYGGVARVHVAVDRGSVCVTIDDDGPGIDQAAIETMFEPFVRAEASRNRATGGSGLGLTIARAIARQHGGAVTLANRPGGGLTARLSLPG